MKQLALFICLSLSLVGCHRRFSDNPTSNSFLRVNGSISVDGINRTFLLNLPPKYNDSTGFSLVLALHGGGGSAAQMERDYLLTQKANASQFVIVYPEGVQSNKLLKLRTWNGGTCCDYAVDNQIDDVKFISLLIDDLLKKYPKINPKKVYATGMSNGAIMSYRLACELSDKIAAIAPVSGTLSTTQPCQPARAVPILHIHSKLDKKEPFNGGTGIFGIYFNPVNDGINILLKNNGCQSVSKKETNFENYTLTQWTDCNTNSVIELYMTNDGGHAWPGGLHSRAAADVPSKAFVANDLIWDFFQKYQLP